MKKRWSTIIKLNLVIKKQRENRKMLIMKYIPTWSALWLMQLIECTLLSVCMVTTKTYAGSSINENFETLKINVVKAVIYIIPAILKTFTWLTFLLWEKWISKLQTMWTPHETQVQYLQICFVYLACTSRNYKLEICRRKVN